MLDNSNSLEQAESEQNKKTAIILIPGFRSKHLAYGVWNQLQQNKNPNSLKAQNIYNVITNDSFKSQKSLHIYELDWSEETYLDKSRENKFYQVNLSLKVLWNSLSSVFYVFGNSLRFSPLCISLTPKRNQDLSSKRNQYWRFFRSFCSAFLLPAVLILIPIISIILLLVNLVVACLIIYGFVKDLSNNFIENIIKFPDFIFAQLNVIFEGLSHSIVNLIQHIISNINTISLLNLTLNVSKTEITNTTKILLSFLLILVWIIAIGFNSYIKKILELSDFTNNYCQNELLRLKIRQKLLKTFNSVLLDSTYKEIVIISHSFGVLLAIDLLANIYSSKSIKHISFGNIIGVTGIRYFDFIYNIVEKNKNKQYNWTDYCAWFDFFATKMPEENDKNLIQRTVGYDRKNLLSLFTSKYHLVYFMKKAYVKESCMKKAYVKESCKHYVKESCKHISPLEEILADYDPTFSKTTP